MKSVGSKKTLAANISTNGFELSNEEASGRVEKDSSPFKSPSPSKSSCALATRTLLDNRDVYCFATTEAQSRQVGVDANVKNFPRHQIRIRILRGVCSPPELVGVAGSHRRTRVQIAEIKCQAHKKGLVEKI